MQTAEQDQQQDVVEPLPFQVEAGSNARVLEVIGHTVALAGTGGRYEVRHKAEPFRSGLLGYRACEVLVSLLEALDVEPRAALLTATRMVVDLAPEADKLPVECECCGEPTPWAIASPALSEEGDPDGYLCPPCVVYLKGELIIRDARGESTAGPSEQPAPDLIAETDAMLAGAAEEPPAVRVQVFPDRRAQGAAGRSSAHRSGYSEVETSSRAGLPEANSAAAPGGESELQRQVAGLAEQLRSVELRLLKLEGPR
jgi:hypothetical protein